MKNKLGFLFLCLALLHLPIAYASKANNEKEHAIVCPKSDKEWKNHFYSSLGPKNQLKFPLRKAASYFKKVWEACHHKASDTVKSCLKRPIDYFSMNFFKTGWKSQMGWDLPDQEYLEKYKHLIKFPKLMNVYYSEEEYQDLLKKYPNDTHDIARIRKGVLPQNWKSILEGCKKDLNSHAQCEPGMKDWLFTEFISNNVNTYCDVNKKNGFISDEILSFRTVILVPGKGSNPDVLYMYAVKKIKGKPALTSKIVRKTPWHEISRQNEIADIIILKKNHGKSKQIESLSPIFFQTANNGEPFAIGKCIDCHPSGPRQIYPRYGSVMDRASEEGLKNINRYIENLPKVNYSHLRKDIWNRDKVGPFFTDMGQECGYCHSTDSHKKPITSLNSTSMVAGKMGALEFTMPHGEYDQNLSYINQFLSRADNLSLSKKRELSLAYCDYKEKSDLNKDGLQEDLFIRKGQVEFLFKNELLNRSEIEELNSLIDQTHQKNQTLYQKLLKKYQDKFYDWITQDVENCI